ncbi:MAG: ECF transporter S component [Oscillospiraceae bacterium]|nr:ECF transporter S component [Oscillospiraceae bacterium]
MKSARSLTFLALLTAIVVVLQFLGAFVRFGPFSVSLVLLPIVIGAALAGPLSGGWLGLVFGLVVLLSGDAGVFLAIDPVGAIIIVLGKGIVAGLGAGLFYRIFEKANKTLAAVAAAAICPIGNTGIFILGLYIFFLPTMRQWGADAGFENVTAFIFLGMVGLNFVFEFALNIILSPTIVRLIQLGVDGRLKAR